MPCLRSLHGRPVLSSFARPTSTHRPNPTNPSLMHIDTNTSSLASAGHWHHIIGAAWRSSTKNRYNHSIRDYIEFCNQYNVPPQNIIPASEDLLCLYASSHVGLVAGSTVANKLSAIQSWHIANNIKYHGGLQLKYVVRAIENSRPANYRRRPCPPVDLPTLLAIRNSTDITKSLDACVWAIITTSFWGQIRLGEILPPRESVSSQISLPTWSDFGHPNNSGSRSLHLPSTKTGESLGETIFVTRQHATYDPISALENHSIVNACKPSDNLASYISNGTRKGLTKNKLLQFIAPILKKHNLPAISGHCFRIGGTTHLLISGVPPDVVRIMGRWTSDAFLRYWRSLE